LRKIEEEEREKVKSRSVSNETKARENNQEDNGSRVDSKISS